METELFVHFAEIAGVFVGFGALISLRSAPLSDAHDVLYLRRAGTGTSTGSAGCRTFASQ